MKDAMKNVKRGAACLVALAVLAQPAVVPGLHAYVLNRTIPASPGGCPQLNRMPSTTSGVDRRWNPTLNSNVLTTASGSLRIDEVENVVKASFDVWTSVGTSLQPNSLASLVRIASPGANDCTSQDGRNSICFAQSASFSTSVLAFTTTVTSDIVPKNFGPKTSSFFGQILDSDILFNPAESFATPTAIVSTAYDMESVMIHEIGHLFGFSHSGVLRAMMYPFAPGKGAFTGDRPSQTSPSGPLADDDRAGLRVLYPNPSNPNVGTISGFILPANSLSLTILTPPAPNRSFTGVFGTHVVTVDADSGAVVAGTLGGWSCDPADLPVKFDGFYKIEGLPVSRNYKIFVEPLDGPTDNGDIRNALFDLCRNDVPQPCTLQTEILPNDISPSPRIHKNLTTKIKP